MISVVIADDEPIIIKGLYKLIPWEEKRMKIIAEANDGRELLEAIEKYEPDIVISDISMPHFTGIDILKKVNERGLACKIIFISAHQDFAYAKDAIRFGAIDYLVKPIRREDLNTVLTKAIMQIRTKDEALKIEGKLQHFEQKSHNEQMKQGLAELTEGMMSLQSDSFQMMRGLFKGPLLTICIVKIDTINDDAKRWATTEMNLVHFALENVISELINNRNKGFVFLKNNTHVVLLEHSSLSDSMEMAHVLKDEIHNYIKINVTVGIGTTVDKLEDIIASYNDAYQAVQLAYFMGMNRVITYEAQQHKEAENTELYELQSKVIQAMIAYRWKDAYQTLHKLLETIKMTTFGNKSLAISTCFSTVLFIVQEVKKSGVHLTFDIHDLQSRLGQYESYEEMANGIIDILTELYNRLDDKVENREKVLMLRINKYIHENYASDISLESVAAIAYMNPYYFSSFFKKQTDKNFKQYVTELRMVEAHRLLTQTDLLVYEVAERVGYNSARQFSDTFKKTFNQLPQEYKQSIKSEDSDN